MNIKRGTVIEYLDHINGDFKIGVIISNNTCLKYSPVYQIIPLERKGERLVPIASKETVIDKKYIIACIHIMCGKEIEKLEEEIATNHSVIGEKFKLGEVYFANIPDRKNRVQTGQRPVLLVSGKITDNNVLVCPVTSKLKKLELPTHIEVKAEESFLIKDSVVLTEAEMDIPINCLERYLGKFDEKTMRDIKKGIYIQHGIRAAI